AVGAASSAALTVQSMFCRTSWMSETAILFFFFKPKTAYEISAPDNRVGDATTGNIADFDRAGNQGGDVGRRGRNEDQIYVQAIFLIDPFVLGDIPIGVRSIHRAVGNLEFFLRVSLATNKQECRHDKTHSPMWPYSHKHRILLLPLQRS